MALLSHSLTHSTHNKRLTAESSKSTSMFVNHRTEMDRAEITESPRVTPESSRVVEVDIYTSINNYTIILS